MTTEDANIALMDSFGTLNRSEIFTMLKYFLVAGWPKDIVQSHVIA